MASQPPKPQRPEATPAEERPLERVDLMHLPLGVYVLDVEGRFRGCNDGVRAILGLPPEGPVEARITDFYAEPERFADLCDAALRAERRGGGFRKEVVPLRVGGRGAIVENYLKPQRDPERGLLVGYVGCMVDITEEHKSAALGAELQKKVEDLTFDIGRILHANTSTLLMVSQTLQAASTALAWGDAADPRIEVDADADPDELLSPVAADLARALERLCAAGEPERRLEALPAEDWRRLEVQLEALRDLEQKVPVKEMRTPALRMSAALVADACSRIAPGWLPREPVREAARLARELMRRAGLVEVAKTRAAVLQMDLTLRSLRDFVTAEVRAPERTRRVPVDVLVQDAIKQLADFARASGVEVSWQKRAGDLEVRGNERDLVRALCNLLHNAIKYSWRRERGANPWVTIRVAPADERGRGVSIEFESWGVPITPPEIEQGLIFQIGYRGKWSTDRGRLGTGIGLTDAQRVARAHGGEVEVESRPAHATSLGPEDREYFERPFLTRVRLRLPLAG
jgi:signal transduction histidine kinase